MTSFRGGSRNSKNRCERCGRKRSSRLPRRYILFNKPFDVLSQFTADHPGQRTLKDFVPVAGVYAAGRLDRDSEGLLLLTDDGELQHRLTDPRNGHPRTYWAQVEGVPAAAALEQLAAGVKIQGYRTLPAEVRLLEKEPELWPRNPPIRFRKNIPTAWIEIKLTEGRNRQVRRMTAAVGRPTLRLVRIAMANVTLEGLLPGQWRDLTPEQLAAALRTRR